jgi:hypothetical protein
MSVWCLLSATFTDLKNLGRCQDAVPQVHYQENVMTFKQMPDPIVANTQPAAAAIVDGNKAEAVAVAVEPAAVAAEPAAEPAAEA